MPVDTMLAQLGTVIKSGQLSTAHRAHAEALARRLSAPVRVTIFGLPGSGKSELLNLLLGGRDIPAISKTPTCEVFWAGTPVAHVVRAGGKREDHDWPLPKDFDWSDTVFLRVGLPRAVLQDATFLEVVTNGLPENVTEALGWAIPRTDIGLWCTQGFTPIERALWGAAPEALKGHSYLVVTRADELGKAGTLGDVLRQMNAYVPDEFGQLFAVVTPMYLAAIGPDGTPPANVRAASGGGAIVDALDVHIRRGRQANLDAAEVFLARYGKDILAASQKPGPQEPAVLQGDRVEKPVATPPARSVEPDPPAAAGSPAWVSLAQARAALGDLAAEEDDIADAVLTGCADAVDDLLVNLSGAPDMDPRILEEVEEAQEQIILMQLEGDESSAADAATVLLQLTRALKPAQAA